MGALQTSGDEIERAKIVAKHTGKTVVDLIADLLIFKADQHGMYLCSSSAAILAEATIVQQSNFVFANRQSRLNPDRQRCRY